MTDQELFDKVKNHLLTQSAKSEDVLGQCLYRGPNGLRCAVGVVIDDNWYSTDLEGKGAYNPKITSLLRNNLKFTFNQVTILKRLQIIHDERQVKNWPFELKKAALDFNLNP
jgi:hypothetical protein